MGKIINLNEYRELRSIITNKDKNQHEIYDDREWLQRLKMVQEYTEYFADEDNWNLYVETANLGLD